MGRPRTLTPTARGEEILKLLDERHGTINKAARAADMNEATLRHWIYGEPTRLTTDIAARLKRLWVPARLLK